MKLTIIGSGGCVCTPKPLCTCRVCAEAREKGHPYARFGPSLYLEDSALLVDTPEDVAHALNHAGIKRVDNIIYSHWDPDHSLGMRVMEQLRLEWLDYYEGISPAEPLMLFAHPDVMTDLEGIRSKFGPILAYYESMGLIKRQAVVDEVAFDVMGGDLYERRSFMLGDVKISLVQVPKEKGVSVFVFEVAGKKAIYAPCDCKPFPENELFFDADILIIGNTVLGDTLKNGRTLTASHPLRKVLHMFPDVLKLREHYRIKRLVMCHIEEDWGKSYDDYRAWEKELDNVQFAYDGMEIEL